MNLQYLKKNRQLKNLTQKQLAEKIGIKYGTYRQVEIGLKNVSLKTFAKLVQVLELDANKLLSIEEHHTSA